MVSDGLTNEVHLLNWLLYVWVLVALLWQPARWGIDHGGIVHANWCAAVPATRILIWVTVLCRVELLRTLIRHTSGYQGASVVSQKEQP